MSTNSKYIKTVVWCRAKAGGADPEVNVALQQVIDQAKKANVPKDIIERNLKRASDKDATTLTDEVLLPQATCTLMKRVRRTEASSCLNVVTHCVVQVVEVYGPGGTGVIPSTSFLAVLGGHAQPCTSNT
jgi:hypothetical protein